MYPHQVRTWIGVVLVGLIVAQVTAQPVSPTDLDALSLGAKIIGPVGPEVDTTFVNVNGEGIGDLISSVSCPDGFADCVPPNNQPGTIYTYVHTVTPGVDFPNDDPPFTPPNTVVPFDDVTEFELGFAAAGFNGIAGYSFSEASAALGTADGVTIEQLGDDSLSWTVSTDDWDSGESITFFWQTTQFPSGPGGTYAISDGLISGVGAGPLPTAVPEPGSAVVLALLGLAAAAVRRRQCDTILV